MVRISPLSRSRTRLLFAGLIGLLAASAAAPVHARVVQGPVVDIGSAPMMSADGRAVGVSVLASCPARWSVAEARVSVAQGGASGSATFPLACGVGIRQFRVLMPATSGTFQLGAVRLDAVVRIARGKTAEARDSETAQLEPEVFLDAAGVARLASGGAAVSIDVTTACPIGTTGQESYAVVEQGGRAIGRAFFTPACDGARRTITLTIPTLSGPYQVGPATVTAFAFVDYQGNSFTGVDSSAIQIVGP